MQGYSGPQYRFEDLNEKYHFYDALTGKALSEINENEAKNIAESIYVGTQPVLNIRKLTTNSLEYRKRVPAWRVEFDDTESATFYIASDNGQLMSVRNDRWRIFDFVWMLHIMDYEDRTDFNHWLLILSAALSVIITLSGLYLVLKTFTKRDFGLK